jgi:hypothetical protein
LTVGMAAVCAVEWLLAGPPADALVDATLVAFGTLLLLGW